MPSSSPPFPPRSPILVTIVTLAVFFPLDHDPWRLFRALTDDPEGLSFLFALTVYRWLPYLVVPLLIAALLFGPRRAAEAVGLHHAPWKALLFAGLVTAILPVAFIASGAPLRAVEAPAREIIQYAVLPGIGEEMLYRSFLFGFLFRFAGWGFLPAALLGGLIFGVGHVYQGGDVTEALTIFAITASGGVWFAWLYAEWDYNIWVPVGFHLLMNFWWQLFDVSDNAAGPAYANAARLAVIIISIAVTIIAARRRGGRHIVGRRWVA